MKWQVRGHGSEHGWPFFWPLKIEKEDVDPRDRVCGSGGIAWACGEWLYLFGMREYLQRHDHMKSSEYWKPCWKFCMV